MQCAWGELAVRACQAGCSWYWGCRLGETCPGAHPSVILPSVTTSVPAVCKLLRVQAHQGSNSVMHIRLFSEEKATS